MKDTFTLKAFFDAFQEDASRLGLEGDSILPSSHVSLYEEIDSTNSELLRRLEEGGPLLDEKGRLTERGKELNRSLVAAASQTAGRGRIGRRFYSPRNSGIYFSFLAVPEGGIVDPSHYTVTAAVGVCRAIDTLYGIHSGIKWVNDIYIGGKKVCGILTEGFSAPAAQTSPDSPLGFSGVQAAVIGIGINMTTNNGLPEELASKAAGIADQALSLGCPPEKLAGVSRSDLLAACMAQILHLLAEKEDLMEEYASRSILTGRQVQVSPLIGDEKTCYQAKVIGIGKDFSLLVKTADGQKKALRSGEVTLKL